MNSENVYFEFYFYAGGEGVAPLPLRFNEFSNKDPIIYNIQNYNVCISNFNINISNIPNKNKIKRINFYSYKLGSYEWQNFNDKSIKKPLIFSYYPSQTELSTQSILNYNANYPFLHDIESNGNIYDLDLVITVEYSNNSEDEIQIPIGDYASVMMKFEKKKDILHMK